MKFGGSTFKFWGRSWGPGVPLWNFRGGPGPSLKLLERVWATGAQGPWSQIPGPTFTLCRSTEDQNLKRLDWKIGKINKLLCSNNGEVRSAEDIVINRGWKIELRRPINKLYPFEYSTEKYKVKLNFVKDEGNKAMPKGVYWIRESV